jgi:hypothetical protein
MTAPRRAELRLFEPGARLGWSFRDRGGEMREYPYAGPDPESLGHTLESRYEQQRKAIAARLKRGGALGGGLMSLLCCGALTIANGQPTSAVAGLAILLLLPAAAATLGWLAWYGVRHYRVRAAWRQIPATVEGQLRMAEHQRAAWYATEAARTAELPEWFAVPAPAARLDVYGGVRWSWEALLTVYGAGVLAEGRRMLVADLSGDRVAAELAGLATSAGFAVRDQNLPDDLGASALFDGLGTNELVDVLVEATHGGDRGGGRADRSLDADVLHGLCALLGDDVTPARIVAGLRALTGRGRDSSLLSTAEIAAIDSTLLSDDERRDALREIRRLAACLRPLAGAGRGAPTGPDPQLRCVAVNGDGADTGAELLADLLTQWGIRRIAGAAAGRPDVLVVAGADRIQDRHLQRLSDVCSRNGVHLLLLFRRLRDHADRMLGGGATAFMRLEHHDDARRAADFIGRQHRFLVTGLTSTLGGGETHTTGTSETVNENTTHGTNTGWNTSTNTGRSSSRGGQSGSVLPTGWNHSTQNGRTAGVSGGANHSTSTGRSWGLTQSRADSTNWSSSVNAQRVHEHTVEPATVQSLPDYLLLLVERRSGGTGVTSVEVNPDTVTLPGVSMAPPPEPGEAVFTAPPMAGASLAPTEPVRW